MTAMLPRRSSGQPDHENLFGPVAGLSALATQLAEIPLGPRPAFRTELRARLLEETKRAGGGQLTVPAPSSADGRSTRRRYGRRTAAVGLALALTGGGVAAAANRSLPGQPLYPVKRFGQSLRLALEPGSDVGPSLRLVSSRISEVERTAALDPAGADASRWAAVDSGLADAGARLVQISAAAPAQELRTALTADRARLDQLLPVVPAAHQSAVQQLRDMIDGLTAAPVEDTGTAPPGTLRSGVSPSDALAAGWPLDPATLRPSAPLPEPPTQTQAAAVAGRSGAGSAPSVTGGPGTATGTGTRTAAPGASSVPLPQLPRVQSRTPTGGGDAPSSSGRVLSRTSTALSGTVAGTVHGTGGGGGSGTGSTGTTPTGSLGSTADGIVGDATDTVGHLPVTINVSGTTTSR